MPINKKNKTIKVEELICEGTGTCDKTKPKIKYDKDASKYDLTYEDQALVIDGKVLCVNCMFEGNGLERPLIKKPMPNRFTK